MPAWEDSLRKYTSTSWEAGGPGESTLVAEIRLALAEVNRLRTDYANLKEAHTQTDDRLERIDEVGIKACPDWKEGTRPQFGDGIDYLLELPGEVERLRAVIRQQRMAWFGSHLLSRPHERQWESDAEEATRIAQNKSLKAKYEKQTAGILQGEDYPLSPRCPACMDRARPTP